jgi:transcription elongation factor Elf1
MSNHDPISCPYCKRSSTKHVVLSQTRIFRDLDCDKCGGSFRIDRATGRLVARLTTSKEMNS